MRVSEYYQLGQTQGELDFVDVDITGDTKLYIDPRAILQLETRWANSCIASIQSFFQRIIDAIQQNDDEYAIALLSELREPNESHLGLSEGRSRGNALGDKLAIKFWESLSKSRVIHTGIIQDLEDTALLIEGIDRDRISDVTTNLIRGQLIEYTQSVCGFYSIPLTANVSSGPIWHSTEGIWKDGYTQLPTPENERLILVPKVIVRKILHLDAGEFFRHNVLNFLVSQEAASRSLGAAIRGNRSSGVTKKSVETKYMAEFGASKRISNYVVQDNPDVLEAYKRHKLQVPNPPMPSDDLAEAVGSTRTNLRALLEELQQTTPGRNDADKYERCVEALLSAMFYPHLVYPIRQMPINEGRKRIDISYTNDSTHGFFAWLARNYPAPQVFVECKNYTHPVANPEIDQLQGRFTQSRGMVGFLVYRGFGDKERVWASCVDVARARNGYIIPLDDNDLANLVDEYLEPVHSEAFKYLHDRFLRLINN